jgi:hypothetical protein
MSGPVGSPSPVKGAVSPLANPGSLAIVTRSSNTFSPSSVPPPRFEKYERPSSAERASKAPMIRDISMPTAVGSSTVSYVPGSKPVFPRHASHFASASAAIRSDSIVVQSAPSSPAQP